MKRFLACILCVIMVFSVVACNKNNQQNSGSGGFSSEIKNSESGSIGGLTSGSASSSIRDSASNLGSSSIDDEPDTPPEPLAPFERISAMDGNIFSLTFDKETIFTPLYADDVTPGKWDNTTKKGLYQNFSIKNKEGSPKTNYISVGEGVAKLVDNSNGGTKMIIDFGDKDIDNGAIEGYFEFKMLDCGPGWTPIQFMGTDDVKTNSEIFGVRTTNTALSNGDIEAGVRLDGDSNNIKKQSIIFKTDYTYSFNFDFNLAYGRFSVKIDCLEEPYGEEYVFEIDKDVKSVQGVCFSTSDTGMRHGHLDNFALSCYSGTKIFVDELNGYAKKCSQDAGEETIPTKINDLCKEFEDALINLTDNSHKQLLQTYKQKIYDSYVAESENFVVNSTMTEFIDYFLDTTPSYRPSWASEGFKNRWNYIDGVFLEGLVQNYERTNKERYKNFFIRYINYYINEEGKSLDAKFRKPESGTNSAYYGNELDSVCESRILFDAYNYTGDKRYLEAIDFTYNKLKTTVPMAGNSGCYSHKSGYRDQVWLDGFYMYAPFTIRYANLKNDENLRTELVNQFKFVYDNMKDDRGLYRHGIDVTKSQSWADKDTGVSQNTWLRAEGWLLASIIDCIEYYPDGENKEFLKKMFAEAMQSIVKHSDSETGLYYNVVGYDSTTAEGNYLETSGSALVAYACMKGARLGVLAESFGAQGIKTFNGIFDSKLSKKGNEYVLKDIILSAGLGSGRNGSAKYYNSEKRCENDGKGVGPFLMAYNEFALYKTNSN